MIPSEYDDIARFSTFVSELFTVDPRLGEVTGATPEDVAALEGRTRGFALPSLYRGYLERFGGNDGPIRLGNDASWDAKSVLRYHAAKDGGVAAPPRCVLVSRRGISFAYALHFEQEGQPPTVVVNDIDAIERTVAASFGNLLYRHAWLRCHFVSGTAAHYRGSNGHTVGAVAAHAQSVGFVPTFFADAYHFAAEHDGVRLHACADAVAVRVALASDDVWEAHNAGEALRAALELEDG